MQELNASSLGHLLQRIATLNPNNIDGAKQIVRLKNELDVAQHLGKVPKSDELSKALS